MADNWKLQVIINKDVTDKETGIEQFKLIETRLAGYPGVEVRGYLTNCERLPLPIPE